MRRMLAILVASLLAVGGCRGAGATAGALVVRDAAGNVVATGTLRLPDPLPPVGERFEGAWSLTSSSDPFPAGAARSGQYAGNVHEGGVTCDLSPGMADNNVLLTGTVRGGQFAGTWSHATFAGPRELGTFAVTLPTRGARR